jgi:hypothetical protein
MTILGPNWESKVPVVSTTVRLSQDKRMHLSVVGDCTLVVLMGNVDGFFGF